MQSRIMAICLAVVSFGVSRAAGQFEKHVDRIPNQANTITLVDVAGLRAELASKPEYAAALSLIPNDVSRMVAASKMDFSIFQEVQSMVSVDLTHEPSFPKIAAAGAGSIDNIQGKEVAVLPGDAFVVRMGPRDVVAGFPAVRQDVVRYLRTKSLTGSIHEYLKEAQQFAERGSQVIIALDLAGVVSEDEIRQRTDTTDVEIPEGTDVDGLISTIAGLRGISVGVNVTDNGVFGSVKVDFDDEVTPLKPVAKMILLDALEKHGATINEFYEWEMKFGERSVRLSGELGPSGMLRLMSLLEAPPELRPLESPDVSDEASKKRLAVTASQSYFQTMEALVDDLMKRKKRSKTMGQIGVWYRRYAKKIDELPIQHVDGQLLECGRFISNSLRQGAGGVTEAAARSRVRQNSVADQYDVRTWSNPIGVVGGSSWRGPWNAPPRVYSWNGWSATPNSRRRGQIQSRIRKEERIQGFYAANLALQQIEEALQTTRYELTQKYDAEF